MANNYSVKLEPYKGMATRFDCPQCHKRKIFTRYIYTETCEHIAEHVGKCERINNCGYHYTPAQYFADTGSIQPNQTTFSKVITIEPKPSFTDADILNSSLQAYEQNNLVQYLIGKFGTSLVKQAVSKYAIGTSKHFGGGSTVFWQIDIAGKIRAGKVMQYNMQTGKRDKNLNATWVHAILKASKYNLKQCFFGEHLIKGNTKPIAIVESEKTAIIASLYLPMFIWLAAGGKDGLSADKCKVLKGRKVRLYPDLGKGFDEWSIKAKLCGLAVSDILERNATDIERQNGLDLADYLLSFDLSEFNSQPQLPADGEPIHAISTPERNIAALAATIQATPKSLPEPTPEHQQPVVEDWRKELSELKVFFEKSTLPTDPIQVEQGETILNVAVFIETNFETAMAQNGKPYFEVYLNRLKLLKSHLQNIR